MRAHPELQVIETARGQALADEFGIKFFETSAKNNINVEKAFTEIARDVMIRLRDQVIPPWFQNGLNDRVRRRQRMAGKRQEIRWTWLVAGSRARKVAVSFDDHSLACVGFLIGVEDKDRDMLSLCEV
eukprot:750036-Hanusia_phi.AAC.4